MNPILEKKKTEIKPKNVFKKNLSIFSSRIIY